MFDRTMLRLKEGCLNEVVLINLRNELPAIRALWSLLNKLFHIKSQPITHLALSGLSLETININCKWPVKLILAADSQFRGRSIITQAIWNIPLYFNVYFILYMSYLIFKSIAGHKIILPHIKHFN